MLGKAAYARRSGQWFLAATGKAMCPGSPRADEDGGKGTLERIADELGVSVSTVKRAVG